MRSILSRFVAVALAVCSLSACALVGGRGSRTTREVDAAIARGDTNRAIDVLAHESDASPEEFAMLGALYRSRNTIRDRLRSKEALEEGLRQYPDDPTLLVELGKTLFRQSFYPDARRCFNKALTIDYGNCEAHYYLGLDWFRRWKHVQVYTDYLESSLVHFEHVTTCDPQNRDAYFKLAFGWYVLQDTSSAIATCRSMLKAHDDASEAHLLIAAIAFDAGKYLAAWQSIENAFAFLGEEECDEYLNISHLLADDDRTAYESMLKIERRDFERVFWVELDPDLTTELNERKVEHICRMFLADAYYRNDRPFFRGWDTARGKALVKFGRPVAVNTTLSGPSLAGRMELWTYGSGMTFFFRDEYLNGNYMVPMGERYEYVAQALQLDPPRTSYDSPYWTIPGTMDVYSFKNAASSDVYVVLGINVETLKDFVDLSDTGYFLTRTAFFDHDWRPYSYEADTLSGAPIRELSMRGERWFQMVNYYDMPFDYHRVAFCLEDQLASIQTRLRNETSTVEYLSDSLMLSDVLLCEAPPEYRWQQGIIRRAGREYYPNVSREYAAGDKLQMYFEVYNLAARDRRSRYQITYSIHRAPDPPGGTLTKIGRGLKRVAGILTTPEPVISQTIDRSAAGHEAWESLAIDIEALGPDNYVLTVAVRDMLTDEETVRSARFTCVEAPAAGP